MKNIIFFGIFFSLVLAYADNDNSNHVIKNFLQAKKIAAQIHKENPKTIYCGCTYTDKEINLESCGYRIHNKKPDRAYRLEWEHVAAAESFGQSFVEWRDAENQPQCPKSSKNKINRRKCAETNPEFSRMEGDLYNLWPEIGELNGLRNNYTMSELGAEKEAVSEFGNCRVKIEVKSENGDSGKFEPQADAKGRVARTLMYMDKAYPNRGIIAGKNRKLYEAWDKLHPVDAWECHRAKLIEDIQKNSNDFVKIPCQQKSMYR